MPGRPRPIVIRVPRAAHPGLNGAGGIALRRLSISRPAEAVATPLAALAVALLVALPWLHRGATGCGRRWQRDAHVTIAVRLSEYAGETADALLAPAPSCGVTETARNCARRRVAHQRAAVCRRRAAPLREISGPSTRK